MRSKITTTSSRARSVRRVARGALAFRPRRSKLDLRMKKKTWQASQMLAKITNVPSERAHRILRGRWMRLQEVDEINAALSNYTNARIDHSNLSGQSVQFAILVGGHRHSISRAEFVRVICDPNNPIYEELEIARSTHFQQGRIDPLEPWPRKK